MITTETNHKTRGITSEELAWLKEFQNVISKARPIYSEFYGKGTAYDWIPMTIEDYEKLKLLIDQCNDIFVEPCNCDMGFHIGFRIQYISYGALFKKHYKKKLFFSDSARPTALSAREVFTELVETEWNVATASKFGIQIKHVSHYEY